MQLIKEYFAIVEMRNLEYLEANGYTTPDIEQCLKFGNTETAKKELSNLDNPMDFAIYKIKQITDFDFELIEEVSKQ